MIIDSLRNIHWSNRPGVASFQDMNELLLLVLGVLAGALSTLAGLGGGILLVLILSAWIDPRTALVTTAPALLLANAHRAWLFRADLDRRVAGAFVLGAFPGALLGSVLTVVLPTEAIAWILLTVALLAAARGLGWIKWTPPPSALGPAGFAAGSVAATSGAGVLVSPVLLASGIRGDAFIATAAATAFAIHVGRILGYGAGGLFSTETLASSALLAVGLFAGNVVGARARHRIGERNMTALTYATLAIVVVLAIAGVA